MIADLGTLGGQRSYPIAINNHGQIIGASETRQKDRYGAPVWHPFLWQGGRMRSIGPPGAHTEVTAINDAGQIVGFREGSNGTAHGFLWQNGKLSDIGAFRPMAINDRGQIVGTVGYGGLQGLLWQKGKRTDLGSPVVSAACYGGSLMINNSGVIAGTCDNGGPIEAFVWQNGRTVRLGATTRAYALNNRGQVVGSLEKRVASGSLSHATLWQAGRLTDLGAFGGDQSAAVDINDRGQVAVSRWNGTRGWNAKEQAFVWRGGRAIAVGALPGWLYSSPVAVTNHGQVIGYSYPASMPPVFESPARDKRAFVWQDGRMIDLGRLNDRYRFTEPVAANERNHIVGIASEKPSTTFADSNSNIDIYHAVLWTLKPAR